MKRTLVILGLSGTLLGASLVGAQSGGTAQDEQTNEAADATTAQTTQTVARRSRLIARLLLGRQLTLGSTLNVTFYDGDPEASGSELQMLTFVYGEDSEAAFAQELETAVAEASHVTVTTSPQTYSLDEADTFLPGGSFGRGGHGLDGGFRGSGRHR